MIQHVQMNQWVAARCAGGWHSEPRWWAAASHKPFGVIPSCHDCDAPGKRGCGSVVHLNMNYLTSIYNGLLHRHLFYSVSIMTSPQETKPCQEKRLLYLQKSRLSRIHTYDCFLYITHVLKGMVWLYDKCLLGKWHVTIKKRIKKIRNSW